VHVKYHSFVITNCKHTCQIGCPEKELLKQDSKPCKDLYPKECSTYKDACNDVHAKYHSFVITNCKYTCQIGCKKSMNIDIDDEQTRNWLKT